MLAITDCRLPVSAENTLLELGHRVLRLPPHPTLPTPIASHPDMLLFFANDFILCTKNYYEVATRELREIANECDVPVHCIDQECGSEYPYDVLLNAVPIGKHLLCNPKTVAQELLRLGLIPIGINQGYTKCSTLPLGSDALITADASIASAARKAGIDVLQIATGHVDLPGYDCGFIGGCTSFAPRGGTDTILFCGALSRHPDSKKIEDFCSRHGYRIKSLGAFSPLDVGTIFLI